MLSNLHKVLIIFGLLFLFVFVVLVYRSVNEFDGDSVDVDKKFTLDFFKNVSVNKKVFEVVSFWTLILLALGLVGFVIFLIFSKGSSKKVVDDFDDERISIPVSIKVARETVWRCWIEQTNVFHRVVDGKVTVADDVRLEFKTCLAFPDPKKETSERFYMLELFCDEGDYPGLNVLIISIDKGVEDIENNLFFRHYTHHNIDMMYKEFPSLPLTSSLSEQIRIQNKIVESVDSDDVEAYQDVLNRLDRASVANGVAKKESVVSSSKSKDSKFKESKSVDSKPEKTNTVQDLIDSYESDNKT